jgi:hypothetical protein
MRKTILIKKASLKEAAEMIRKTKFKRLSSKEINDRAVFDGSIRSEANEANRYAKKHGTGNETPGTKSTRDKDFEYHDDHGHKSFYDSQPRGLSTGAKLGIGAGGAVIGALALRKYLKKRRQEKEQGENK